MSAFDDMIKFGGKPFLSFPSSGQRTVVQHDPFADDCCCVDCMVKAAVPKVMAALGKALDEVESLHGEQGRLSARMMILAQTATVEPSFLSQVLKARRVVQLTQLQNVHAVDDSDNPSVARFGVVGDDALWLTAADGTSVYIHPKELAKRAKDIAGVAGLEIVDPDAPKPSLTPSIDKLADLIQFPADYNPNANDT